MAVAYLALTLAMTWPLAARAGSTVQDRGDPLFEIWVMRSVQHSLAHDPGALYQANAFYPFHNSLAYSEEAIGTALLAAPVWALTGNDVLAYNVIFIGSFWLVAFAVYLLARELGAAPGAAFAAGLLAAFAPARFGHVSHLHMLVIGWLPLALWALARCMHTGRQRWLLLGGAALTMQLYSSLHLALFATLTLTLFLPLLLWFERRRWSRREWVLLAASVVVPYLLFAPTLIPHLRVGQEYDFERTRTEIQQLAATPRLYLAVFPTNRFWAGHLKVAAEPFFPGVVTLLGVVLAASARVWAPRLRCGCGWASAFAATLAGAALLLSFGFHVTLGGHTFPTPFRLLYAALPPARSLRGVGRFGLLTALGLPLLAAFGYSAGWRRLLPRLGPRAARVGLALTVTLALAACLELRTQVGTTRLPNDATTMAVYDWLATQPDGPVIEFPAAGLIHGPFEPIQQMYGSTHDWKPRVAGYSGFIPMPHYDLVFEFDARDGQPSRPTAMNVGLLLDLGVRWVVIHRYPNYDWQAAVASADSLPQLRWVTDVGDSRVYEVTTRRTALPDLLGQLVIPEAARDGGPFGAQLQLHNPWDNLTLARLTIAPTADAVWTRADGSVAWHETLALPLPVALQPGDSSVYLPLTPPRAAGNYLLRVSSGTARVANAQQAVVVHAAPAWSAPPLALVSLVWDTSRPLRAGDTLHVAVTWDVRAPLGADFAATVQLLDADGERRANFDLLPLAGMPSTAAWQPGQRVTLGFDLRLDPALPPGDYTLLSAIYAYQQDFPRVPLQLPDGTQATEARSGGVTVAP